MANDKSLPAAQAEAGLPQGPSGGTGYVTVGGFSAVMSSGRFWLVVGGVALGGMVAAAFHSAASALRSGPF